MSRLVSLPAPVIPRSVLAIILSLSGAWAWAQDAAEFPVDTAAIQPLADRALLLDATTVEGRTVAVGDHGIVLVISEDGSWSPDAVDAHRRVVP